MGVPSWTTSPGSAGVPAPARKLGPPLPRPGGLVRVATSSVLADVLVPDLGILLDEPFHEVHAFGRVDHGDLDARPPEPVDPALEVPVLADEDPRDAELPDQAAAVPAGSQGRHHGRATVALLAAGLAAGVGLPVHRGLVL